MAGFSDLYIYKSATHGDGGGKLTEKSAEILSLLARGKTETDILDNGEFSRKDITTAAREALHLNNSARTRQERMSEIQKRYRRAYEKWSPDEEKRIAELFTAGKTMREIAAVVERQPNAVKSRLDRMGAFRQPNSFS